MARIQAKAIRGVDRTRLEFDEVRPIFMKPKVNDEFWELAVRIKRHGKTIGFVLKSELENQNLPTNTGIPSIKSTEKST